MSKPCDTEAATLRFILMCLDLLREVYPDDLNGYANAMLSIVEIVKQREEPS